MKLIALTLLLCVMVAATWWVRPIRYCEAGSKPGPSIGDAVKISGC